MTPFNRDCSQQKQPIMTLRCLLPKVISITILLLFPGFPTVQAGKDKEIVTWTQIPSPSPSPRPTFRPKDAAPKPTLVPIVAPIVPPSPPPMKKPGPTEPPTVTTTVSLPKIRFTLEATGPLDEIQVNSAVVAFLKFFFSQGYYREAFLYVTFQTILMEGMGTRHWTMRRHLLSKPTHLQNSRTMVAAGLVTLDIDDGMAAYNPNAPTTDGYPAPVPSEEELSTILSAYFSLWGAEKLLEYFRNDGLPVESVSQIVIDGVAIKMDKENEKNASSLTGDDNNGTNNVGILAGAIAAAAVLVFVAIAILVRVQRRKKAAQHEVGMREVGDDRDPNKTATSSTPTKTDLNVSDSEGTFPSPAPLPQPSLADLLSVYQEKQSNPYATDSAAQALSMALTKTTSEDESDGDIISEKQSNPYVTMTLTKTTSEDDQDSVSVSESDGDIISVTESLHHHLHYQGPLITTGATNGANFTDLRPLAMTGKASVREHPPTEPQTSFQYDASRLDQVISDTNNQGL